MEMPRYRCHKVVHALKIEHVELHPIINGQTDGGAELKIADAGFAPVTVDGAYLERHKPEAGGYYVTYADGYKSFSPALAFEDGYHEEPRDLLAKEIAGHHDNARYRDQERMQTLIRVITECGGPPDVSKALSALRPIAQDVLSE